MTRREASLSANAALPPLPKWRTVAALPSDPNDLTVADVSAMFDASVDVLRDIAHLTASHPQPTPQREAV